MAAPPGTEDQPPPYQTETINGIEITPPGYHPQVICGQSHPLPSLKNTFRAFADLPHCCTSVTAHLLVSADGIPFLFNESKKERYNGIGVPEHRTWEVLAKIHVNSTPGPDAGLDWDLRIMSLRRLLDVLSSPQNQHRFAYLDIKSNRNAEYVLGAIESVWTATPHRREDWLQRIVILVPDRSYFPQFLPRGYNVVWNCLRVKEVRDAIDRYPDLHFKFDISVLLSDPGRKLVEVVKERGRRVYIENANKDYEMKWCILQGVDGVITDLPRRLDGLYYEYRQPDSSGWATRKSASLIPRHRRAKGLLAYTRSWIAPEWSPNFPSVRQLIIPRSGDRLPEYRPET